MADAATPAGSASSRPASVIFPLVVSASRSECAEHMKDVPEASALDVDHVGRRSYSTTTSGLGPFDAIEELGGRNVSSYVTEVSGTAAGGSFHLFSDVDVRTASLRCY